MVLAAIRKHHLEARGLAILRFPHPDCDESAGAGNQASDREGAPKDFVSIGRKAGAGIVSPLARLVTPSR
jgi:hypothetical protein